MKSASVSAATKEGTAELRATVANELAEAGASTLSERWWSWVARAMAGLTPATGPISFWVRATCTIGLALLLDFALTLATNRHVFLHFVPRDALWAAFTLSFLLLMRWQFVHHLDVFCVQVLPNLCAEDLVDVRRWIHYLRWIGPQLAFSMVGGALGAIGSQVIIKQSGTPATAGQLLLYFVDFFLMSMLTYLALPLIMLYLRIGGYQFSLYTLNPAHSPVMIAMYGLANGFSLTFAALVTLFIILIVLVYRGSPSIPVSLTILALFTWIPILAFFVVSQQAFSRIIWRVKGRKLAELQARISQLESSADLAKGGDVKLLTGLLDYYQRVASTPNSMLNAAAVLGLVQSLILPLVGLLVAILSAF